MDNRQLSLFDFSAPPAPTKEPARQVEKPVAPTSKIVRNKRGDWCDAYFQKVCSEGTYMIFLYGQNEHLCAGRTHGTDDPGEDIHLMRKFAEKILTHFCFQEHSRYRAAASSRSGPRGYAKVYVADRGAQKKKFGGALPMALPEEGAVS